MKRHLAVLDASRLTRRETKSLLLSTLRMQGANLLAGSIESMPNATFISIRSVCIYETELKLFIGRRQGWRLFGNAKKILISLPLYPFLPGHKQIGSANQSLKQCGNSERF